MRCGAGRGRVGRGGAGRTFLGVALRLVGRVERLLLWPAFSVEGFGSPCQLTHAVAGMQMHGAGLPCHAAAAFNAWPPFVTPAAPRSLSSDVSTTGRVRAAERAACCTAWHGMAYRKGRVATVVGVLQHGNFSLLRKRK